jgi:hypothetical protein
MLLLHTILHGWQLMHLMTQAQPAHQTEGVAAQIQAASASQLTAASKAQGIKRLSLKS